MRQNGRNATAPTDGDSGYEMSEDAQLRLLQVRDQLQMLAALASPRHPHEDASAELMLRPAALARCFEHLAGELDAVLQDMKWRSGPA